MYFNGFGNVNVLWKVCALTRMKKWIVIKEKSANSVIKGVHRGWCINYGYITVGSHDDNGGEFKNYTMDEFTTRVIPHSTF